MKMLIEKNVLMEGLNAVSKALSTRNIIPVLNGIKFELKKDGLYLTATDNDITIQTFIDKKEIRLMTRLTFFSDILTPVVANILFKYCSAK